MIEKSINVSDENYFDNFDNPFEPSPLYSTNIPTHDDWNGLPWNNEPISDTASDTDDDDYDWVTQQFYLWKACQTSPQKKEKSVKS